MAYTYDEIVQEVAAIAAKVCKLDVATISADTAWIDDLQVKSVYAVKLCALFKMKFGIDFLVSDLTACTTIGDTADKISALLAA